MSVYEKLSMIQVSLEAPKSQYNKFGDYNYRSCEDILNAVKPLLAESKASLIISDELILIGERYYIKATAKLMDYETGESVDNAAFAREDLSKKGMDVSQVTGSTSSYARKYALNGLFCIDDVKDSDTTNNTKKPQEKWKTMVSTTRVEKITPPMIETFHSEAKRANKPEKAILAFYKLNKVEDMTIFDFEDCMERFKATPTPTKEVNK